MPQTYMKLRQLIWLLLLFSLFGALVISNFSYAQTGSPPRSSGYVIGNNYYFNAYTNENTFNSCAAQRVTSRQVCASTKEVKTVRSRLYLQGTQIWATQWMEHTNHNYQMVGGQCGTEGRRRGFKDEDYGGYGSGPAWICSFEYRTENECASYRTEYTKGACLTSAQACRENSTLCGYVNNHLDWFNKPPVASNVSLITKENIEGSVTLVATDPDGPTPTVFNVSTQSPYGTATISGNTLTFKPNQNWFGSTTVSYRAQDNKGAWSNTATVNITVTERRLVADDFIYDSLTRSGVIKIRGIDEVPETGMIYLEKGGSTQYQITPSKSVVDSNRAHYDYSLSKAPSGTHKLKADIHDSLGHVYTFTYGDITIYVLKTLGFTYDPVSRDGQLLVEDKGEILRDIKVQLLDEKGGGKYEVTPSCARSLEMIRQCSFNLNDAPEGRYEAKISLIDNFDFDFSTKQGEIIIDKTPADITHSIPRNGQVQYVSDIYFEVIDEYDADITIKSITLFDDESGKEQSLGWEKAGDKIVLDHFSIFPSASTNSNYHIKIETVDHQLNESELVADFYFEPKSFSNETLNVPALLHAFNRPDGSPAIRTDKIRLSTGDVITGQHDIVASLDRNAEHPVEVNGVLVEAGQTRVVASGYNFGREYGQLKLSVVATSEEETNSQLLVSVAAPNAPLGLFNLNFWTPAAKIESNSWTFKQVIDPINMMVRSDNDSLCAITSNEQTARRADPFNQPYCFIEWNQLPDEVTPQTKSENGLQHAALGGQAVEVGTQKIDYSLYIFNGAGNKVHIEDGEYEIEVESALDTMALNAILPEVPVLKLIDELDVRFRQTKGKSCALTLEESQAVRSSSSGIRENSLTCLFEWKELPPEVEQVDWVRQPQARGIVPESGEYNFKWELSVFSQKGVKVLLADQTQQVEVVDPPAPEITLESKYLLEDGKTVVIPINENYVGDVLIEGQRTNMDIEILRNEHVLYDENVQSGFGGYRNIIQRPLNEDRDNRTLWGESLFSVKSTYELMPELLDEKFYSVHSAPVTGAKPFISSPNEFALNTDTLPIHVDILNQYSHRDPYDMERMGEWQVRVMRIPLRGDLEPMSDFMDMEEGHAELDIDIGDIDDVRTLRFTSEAKLIHAIDGYERTEISPRVLILSLLRGDAIEADITTRTLSGPAPLRGSFKIDLKEREMQSATGDIVWELSKDGGNTWEEYIPDERYKFIYNNEFETGIYHLRANITNRHSGASKYTEVIEIIAYDKPELRIEGPTIRFVGDKVVLTATPGYESISNGEKVFTPIELGDTVIEWSTDNGRTYDQEGDSITLFSDSQQRIMVAARVRTTHAPEEDRYAFNVTKTSVEFKPIRSIRVRITGPSLVEVGKEYEFEAVTSLPYRGMGDNILGYFTLPNGEQVEGKTLTYTPTDEDLAGGRMAISYHAWIEGYEDQGTDASHTLRSSIWKYIWPDFAMHYQANAPYAPALLTMTIRPMQAVGNRLEDVKYEWTLPEPIEMLDDSRDIIRKFNVLEAGDYTVRVVITDARGHEAVIEHPMNLEEAIPYQLNLELSPDNAGFREPLTLTVRPRISGGHPRDRFGSLEFTVDDKPVESLSRYAKIDLEKGVYDIGVKMISQMGVITEESTRVEVFENQVPICTVSERESSASVRFTADCTDPDGRMRGYDWQLGDRELVSGSKSITVGRHRLEEINQITLVGIDDSGGRSEPVVISINYQLEGVGEE